MQIIEVSHTTNNNIRISYDKTEVGLLTMVKVIICENTSKAFITLSSNYEVQSLAMVRVNTR